MLATGGMVEARTSRTTGSVMGVGASSQVVKRRGRERIAASMGDGHGSLGEAYRENLVLSKQCGGRVHSSLSSSGPRAGGRERRTAVPCSDRKRVLS